MEYCVQFWAALERRHGHTGTNLGKYPEDDMIGASVTQREAERAQIG